MKLHNTLIGSAKRKVSQLISLWKSICISNAAKLYWLNQLFSSGSNEIMFFGQCKWLWFFRRPEARNYIVFRVSTFIMEHKYLYCNHVCWTVYHNYTPLRLPSCWVYWFYSVRLSVPSSCCVCSVAHCLLHGLYLYVAWECHVLFPGQ